MKTIATIVILFLVGLSCQKTANEFHGVGGLNIGEQFDALPQAKTFTKVMDDEFNNSGCELSKAIGSVSNLNVSTQKGKISEVRFATTKTTHFAEFEKILSDLHEEKIDTTKLIGFTDKTIGIKFYNTPDKKILVTVVHYKDRSFKNGQPYYEVSYKQVGNEEQEHSLTMKSNANHKS